MNEPLGDFRRLLGARGLALELPAVPAAAAGGAPVHGTTVIAVKYRDGVLNVADRRATADTFVLYDEAEKVMALDDFTLIAIAGAYAPAIEAVRFLKHAFKYYARSQLQELSLEGKLAEVSRTLSAALPTALQGLGGFLPVISAYDPRAQSGRVFFYDVLGARFESRQFGAAGSGALQIKGALEYVLRAKGPFTEMSLEAALQETLTLLDIAAALDTATGGLGGTPPIAKTVTAAGVAEVEEELLERALEAVLAGRPARRA